MGRKNIEMVYGGGNTLMEVVDAEAISLEVMRAENGVVYTKVMLGGAVLMTSGAGGVDGFRRRLDCALADDVKLDDPVVFPVSALVAAKEGRHSSGLGYEDILEVVKGVFAKTEAERIVELSDKQAASEPTAIMKWHEKLAGIAREKAKVAEVDVGARLRSGSRAYPGEAGGKRSAPEAGP
jgi:hypothetical protein